MPSEQDHLRVVSRNKAVLDYLLQDPDKCSEWIAVVAFYTAVHLVESMFARVGVHSSDHRSRLNNLKSDRQYRNIYPAFRCLKQASEIARYLGCSGQGASPNAPYRSFSDYMSPAEVQSLLLNKHLREIEDAVQQKP